MGCSRTFVRLLQISMPLEPGFSGILRSVAGMFYDLPMTEMQLRARAQHRAPSTFSDLWANNIVAARQVSGGQTEKFRINY